MASKRTPPKRRAQRPGTRRRRSSARMTRGRQVRVVAVIGVGLAIVVGVVALAVRSSSNEAQSGDVSASAFNLPRLDEHGRVRLARFAGRPTVVNFFASWCTACNAELPDFRQAAGALQGRVNFLFVNSNESGDWRPMAERNGILRFPLAKDINGTGGNGLYRSLGGTGGMPITAFYDSRGKVIDVSYGALTGGLLDQKLQRLYGVPAA
jgi:cytochrome c biogenesis protein CcmG, thiol:disulfide interchange protein DsbE